MSGPAVEVEARILEVATLIYEEIGISRETGRDQGMIDQIYLWIKSADLSPADLLEKLEEYSIRELVDLWIDCEDFR